jgi:hypothetical protein
VEVKENLHMCNDSITLGDVFDRLWKCRDFEISHLWQRSVFLATFLVLVAGGYGKLFECYVEAGLRNPLSPLRFHALAMCISCIGMVVATLWVCMAKASKAWQEKYEDAINDFVARFDLFGDVFSKTSASLDTAKYAGFNFEQLAPKGERDERYWARERNRMPWRTGGSNFSPSRINVFIGQFSWAVWFLLATFHLVRAFAHGVDGNQSDRLLCVAVASAFLMVLILCGFLTFCRNHSPISTQGQ